MLSEDHYSTRIFFEDTDMFGLVYHANYLKYYERGRSEMLRKQGYELQDLYQQGYVFPVTRITIQFIKPVHCNDEITVVTKIVKQGRVSIHYEQHIVCDDEMMNRVEVKVACCDREFVPCAMPEELLL